MQSRTVARVGLLAALYAAITIAAHPISYGPVQIRISELLTLLPFYFGGWAAVGLWIGAMIANVFGGLGLLDIIFGAGITLIAGLLTARAGSLFTASIPPIVLNAFGIAAILHLVTGAPYLPTVLYVGAGQLVAVGVIGVTVMKLMERYEVWEKIKYSLV